MKTRSFLEGPSNIAAIVKARRNPLEQEATPFSQIGNDPLFSNNLTNTNTNNNDSSNQANIVQTGIPEKKVITKTLWSVEEKILFFTALKNYGKNFNEVSRFIKGRGSRLNSKKTGKSKEQVRVFYNRTWNHLKQFLKFPMEVPQPVQELYALINYSVFRTRVKKVLNGRLGDKLNEMVLNGSTMIKSNGKRVTLRTPVCPALKRLNNVKTPEQEYTIPDDIIVELVPRNYVTLWRVQQIEQNPRMRLKVAVNRQLSDVINFLSSKLKSAAQLIRETLALPPIESPKLHIRLSEDARFFKEIVIQEVTKPRYDSITFRSYCENILQCGLPPGPVANSGGHRPQTLSSVGMEHQQDNVGAATASPGNDNGIGTNNEVPLVKIDYSEMQRKLMAGVGIEDLRDMKLLALYIGLGCPPVIRFTYEYRHPSDMDSADSAISNGLRRLLHLSKHDYLENKLNKETKSQLEKEIGDMQHKLDDMKRQLANLEADRFGDFAGGRCFDADDEFLTTTAAAMMSMNETANPLGGGGGGRPYVYKKQQEALKQLMEDLPNKNNVVINQVEYASDQPLGGGTSGSGGSALDNMKRFHRNRKRPKSVNNNITIPAVYTLKLPLSMSDAVANGQDNPMENASDVPNMYGALQHSLYHPGGGGDVYIGGANNNPLMCPNSSNAMSSLIAHHVNNVNDHCDNTNDSLRSFLNDMAESHNSVDQLAADTIDYQGIFHQFVNDDPPSMMQSHNGHHHMQHHRSTDKSEESNPGIGVDSESGSSLFQFLNAGIKSDK